MPKQQRKTILLGLLLIVCGGLGMWFLLPDWRLRYTIHTDSPLFYVTFSPNGQLLATSGLNGEIQLWNAVDGTLIRVLQGHTREADLAFHPSGERLVSASVDGTIRLWSVATGQQLNLLWTNPPAPGYGVTSRRSDGRIVTEHEEFISVDFSPDGNLIAVGSDIGRVIIFRSDLSVSQILSVSIERSDTPGYPASSIDISQNNQLLLVKAAYGVRLWDFSKQRPIKHFTRETTKGLFYTPGYAQFRSNNPTIRTFFGGDTKAMSGVVDDWSLHGQLLTPGKVESDFNFIFFKSGVSATGFAVNHNEEMLAWGGGTHLGAYHNVPFIGPRNDPRIFVWRVGEAEPAYIFSGHEDNVEDLAFSPDGSFLASVGYDQTLRVWRLTDFWDIWGLQPR